MGMEISVDNASVERLVDHHIKQAVAEALSSKTDYLVQQLVEAALTKPVLDSYGRPKERNGRRVTVVDNAVEKLICEAANEAAAEWLDDQRPQIKKLVRQRLNSQTKGLVAQLADKLTTSLAKDLQCGVWFRSSD